MQNRTFRKIFSRAWGRPIGVVSPENGEEDPVLLHPSIRTTARGFAPQWPANCGLIDPSIEVNFQLVDGHWRGRKKYMISLERLEKIRNELRHGLEVWDEHQPSEDLGLITISSSDCNKEEGVIYQTYPCQVQAPNQYPIMEIPTHIYYQVAQTMHSRSKKLSKNDSDIPDDVYVNAGQQCLAY